MNHNDQDDDKDMDKRASVEQKTKKKFRRKIIPKTKSSRRAGGAEKTRRPPSERSTRRGGRRGRDKKNKRDTTKPGRKIVFKRKTVDKSKRDTKNAERKVQDAQRPRSARMPRDSKKSSSVKKPSKNPHSDTESTAAKSTTRIAFKRKVVDESKKDDRDADRVQDWRQRSAREPRNSELDPTKSNFVKKSSTCDDPRYKTKMCRRWMNTGICSHGDRCHFAHGADDLRTRKMTMKYFPATVARTNANMMPTSTKTIQRYTEKMKYSNVPCSDAERNNFASMRQIFVGGLSPKTSKESVAEYFSAFGDVKDVVLAYDRVTRLPKGFAFVEFNSRDPVRKILSDCKAHEYHTYHTIDDMRVRVEGRHYWKPWKCKVDGIPGRMSKDFTWTRVINDADMQAKNVFMHMSRSCRGDAFRVTVFAPSHFIDVKGRTWRVQVVFETHVDMPRGKSSVLRRGSQEPAYVNSYYGFYCRHRRHDDIVQLLNKHAVSEDVRNKIRQQTQGGKTYIVDSCGLKSFDDADRRKSPVIVRSAFRASARSWTPSRRCDASDLRATQTSVPSEVKTADDEEADDTAPNSSSCIIC